MKKTNENVHALWLPVETNDQEFQIPMKKKVTRFDIAFLKTPAANNQGVDVIYFLNIINCTFKKKQPTAIYIT